jgi:histidinol-phosphate phosphatase family protein
MSRTRKKNKAVFIDRDGTIARDVPYCSRPEDFELFPDVPQAIKQLNQGGFKVVVITNQSGVGRGKFTEETLGQIHQKMLNEFKKQGARIDSIYYCPHHPDDNCECRKPKTLLFQRAAHDLNIDFTRSYMIGDMQMDVDAGKAIGCQTVLITAGLPKVNSNDNKSPDYVVDNFPEAVNLVLKKESSK